MLSFGENIYLELEPLQVPPLGFTDSRKMGGEVLICVAKRKVGEGVSLCTMSAPLPTPGFSVGGWSRVETKNGMRGFEGKGNSGEWNLQE